MLSFGNRIIDNTFEEKFSFFKGRITFKASFSWKKLDCTKNFQKKPQIFLNFSIGFQNNINFMKLQKLQNMIRMFSHDTFARLRNSKLRILFSEIWHI